MTPKAVAGLVGRHYRSVRRIAQRHGIGRIVDGHYDFTPEDVEAIRIRCQTAGRKPVDRRRDAICEWCGVSFVTTGRNTRLCSRACYGAFLQEQNERKTCPTLDEIAAETKRIRRGEIVLSDQGGCHAMATEKWCPVCKLEYTAPECVKCAAIEYQRSRGFKV